MQNEQLIQVGQPWPVEVGAVIENEEWRVERKGEPALLHVVRVEKRFIKSDGWSFGLHSNSGTLYTAFCRAATDDEIEAHKAAMRAAAERRKAQREQEARDVQAQIDAEWQIKDIKEDK